MQRMTKTFTFTNTLLSSLTPLKRSHTFCDNQILGLKLEVRPNRQKIFIHARRLNKTYHYTPLGSFETVSLKEARSQAATLNLKKAVGSKIC